MARVGTRPPPDGLAVVALLADLEQEVIAGGVDGSAGIGPQVRVEVPEAKRTRPEVHEREPPGLALGRAWVRRAHLLRSEVAQVDVRERLRAGDRRGHGCRQHR
jgi:hypothetical protein